MLTLKWALECDMNTAIAKPFGVDIANTKDIFDAIYKKVNWHHKHLNFFSYPRAGSNQARSLIACVYTCIPEQMHIALYYHFFTCLKPELRSGIEGFRKFESHPSH